MIHTKQLKTPLNGLLKGNGSIITTATAGTDYSDGTASLATGILKSTTASGVLSIAIAADFPILNQNTTGNAATVTTNANLTGMVTSVGNATTVVTNANLTGMVTSVGNATTVVTNANLTGEVTSVGNATTVLNATVIGKVLTGFNVLGSAIVATDTILQAFGKTQNQINNLLGGVMYISTWAASTNTPTLADGFGTKGNYYVASNNGVVNFGSGNIDFKTGDWAIYNGTIWEKVDNTDAVSSVNGYLGAVSLTTADISEVTNLYFTNARAIGATLTGYTSGAGTITSSDTILTAIQKLDGNSTTLYVPYTGATTNVDLNARTLVNVSTIGIGTATPASVFTILQTSDAETSAIRLERTGAVRGAIYLDSTTDGLLFSRNGSTVMNISPTDVGIGITPVHKLDISATDGTKHALNILNTVTSATANISAVTSNLAITPSSDINFYVVNTGLSIFGTQNITSTTQGAIGIRSTIANSSTGTITNASNINLLFQNVSTGTVTNANGVHIRTATNAGTVTNWYGVRIEPQTVGGSLIAGYASAIAAGTGRYNTYMSGTAQNYFQGNVGIGVAVPASKLSIYVTETASPVALGVNSTNFSMTNSTFYGLIGGVLTGGSTYLQSQRIDGTATANNLLLQPNGGKTGFGTLTPLATVEISDLTGAVLPLFRIQGSAGELFSVYDSLTGSLFSVNDISGLPILEAFSDNTILMGSYLAPSLNTTVKIFAPVGSTVVYSIPFVTYTGGFFEYVITDGTNKRTGSIMYVTDGVSITNTETTTTSIGNTNNLTFTVTIVGPNVVLTAVSAVGTWTIKTIVRAI